MKTPPETTMGGGVVEFPRLAPKQTGFWPEAATVEEAEWLIHGWIPKAATTYLYGTHGTFKSFLIIDMAFCGALGRDMMGFAVDKPFGSIICVGEKKGRFGKRIKAWLKAHDAQGKAPAVFTREGCPDLTNDDTVSDFIDEVNAMKPQFEKRGAPLGAIYIDTLSRALKAGNVSDATTAQSAINSIQRIIDETGCAVIPSAHVAKAEGANTIKGAGEFGDSAEAYIYVERDKENKTVTATLGKQSDGEDGLKFAFTFEMVPVGQGERDEIVSLSLVNVEVPDGPKRGTKALTAEPMKILQALGRCIDEGQTVPVHNVPGPPANGKAVLMRVLRQKAYDLGLRSGEQPDDDADEKTKDRWKDARKKDFERGLKVLETRRLIRREGDQIWPV